MLPGLRERHTTREILAMFPTLVFGDRRKEDEEEEA
jgi:hypothetical protein